MILHDSEMCDEPTVGDFIMNTRKSHIIRKKNNHTREKKKENRNDSKT